MSATIAATATVIKPPCVPRYVTIYFNGPQTPIYPHPLQEGQCSEDGVPQGQLSTIDALYCCPDQIVEYYPTPSL